MKFCDGFVLDEFGFYDAFLRSASSVELSWEKLNGHVITTQHENYNMKTRWKLFRGNRNDHFFSGITLKVFAIEKYILKDILNMSRVCICSKWKLKTPKPSHMTTVGN